MAAIVRRADRGVKTDVAIIPLITNSIDHNSHARGEGLEGAARRICRADEAGVCADKRCRLITWISRLAERDQTREDAIEESAKREPERSRENEARGLIDPDSH